MCHHPFRCYLFPDISPSPFPLSPPAVHGTFSCLSNFADFIIFLIILGSPPPCRTGISWIFHNLSHIFFFFHFPISTPEALAIASNYSPACDSFPLLLPRPPPSPSLLCLSVLIAICSLHFIWLGDLLLEVTLTVDCFRVRSRCSSPRFF